MTLYLKVKGLFCFISKERSCDFKHFLFNICSDILSIGLEKVYFRGWPHNSLKGLFREKIKSVYYLDCWNRKTLIMNVWFLFFSLTVMKFVFRYWCKWRLWEGDGCLFQETELIFLGQPKNEYWKWRNSIFENITDSYTSGRDWKD